MRYISSITISLMFLLSSCGTGNPNPGHKILAYKIVSGRINDHVMVIEVDSCHYITRYGGGIVHKANCPNPIHK